MPNDARLYAIGDVHGHAREAGDLLDRLIIVDGMIPDRDTVIFLGDYVDRGPDSRAVVDMIRDWTNRYPHWRALRGNHEQMMLDALRNGPEDWGTWTMWWYQGGRETAASFAGKRVCDTSPIDAIHSILDGVLEWMGSLVTGTMPFGFGDRYALAHAGFVPTNEWVDTSDHDRMWIRDEFLESDYDFHGFRIVHGHTPVDVPVVRPNRIGIDTILKTGRLTAVELSGDEPRFIQSGGK